MFMTVGAYNLQERNEGKIVDTNWTTVIMTECICIRCFFNFRQEDKCTDDCHSYSFCYLWYWYLFRDRFSNSASAKTKWQPTCR